MRACILIRTQPGTAEGVAQLVQRVAGVAHAWVVFGSVDVAARAEAKDFGALAALVGQIARVKGVAGTETLPEMEVG